MIKSKLTQFHFYLLAFLIVHFIITSFSGFGLNQEIVFVLKVALCLSGLVLFIYHLKPFEKIAFYFSYYFITPIVVLLGYLFGGIFLVGILMSILLFPIMPRSIVFEKEEIVIYNKYRGFMGACCTYEVYQKKYLLFEQYRNEIHSESIEYESFQVLTDEEMNRLKQELKKD